MRYEIGKNAGIIWQTIAAKNGRISFDELLSITGLTKSQALLSLDGWSVKTKCQFMARAEPLRQ